MNYTKRVWSNYLIPLSFLNGSVVDDKLDTSQYRLLERNCRLSHSMVIDCIATVPMVTTCGRS